MWFSFSAIRQATILSSTLLLISNLKSGVFVSAQQAVADSSTDPETFLDSLSLQTYKGGPKSQQYQDIVDTYINALNVTYPPIYGGVNPFDELEGVELITKNGVGNGIATVVGIPNLFSFPKKCKDREFGVSGEFTGQVCRAVKRIFDFCASEPTCDTSKLPAVVPGKADVYKDTESLAFASCLRNDLSAVNCFTPAYVANYVPSIVELQGFLDSGLVPGNYENPLLTNAEYTPVYLDPTTGQGFFSNYHVIGDAYYTLREEVLSSGEELSADITMNILIAFVDQLYVEYYISGETNTAYFKGDFLAGYFAKLYNTDLFPLKVRKEVMPLQKDMSLSKCASALGVLTARSCGFDLTKASAFFEHYVSALPTEGIDSTTSSINAADFFCSPFEPWHYEKAEKWMRKSSLKKSPSTVTLTNQECMETLRFE